MSLPSLFLNRSFSSRTLRIRKHLRRSGENALCSWMASFITAFPMAAYSPTYLQIGMLPHLGITNSAVINIVLSRHSIPKSLAQSSSLRRISNWCHSSYSTRERRKQQERSTETSLGLSSVRPAWLQTQVRSSTRYSVSASSSIASLPTLPGLSATPCLWRSPFRHNSSLSGTK